MKKILIVDDKWSVRNSLLIGLKRIGYQVDSANNVQNALFKLNESKFDVLITDIKMPDVNGFILATIVKELHPDIQIIFMSSYDHGDFWKRYQDLKEFSFVPKPINMTQLLSLLNI